MKLQFCHFQKPGASVALLALAICLANESALSASTPPGATNSSFHLLDLSRFYTFSFTNLSTNRPWTAIPRGRQTNDGVPFQIGGTDQLTGTLRFFKTAIDNPLPDQQIASIDFLSLFGAATPLFFAITAEEAPTPLPALPSLPRRKPVEHAFEFDDSAYIEGLALKIID